MNRMIAFMLAALLLAAAFAFAGCDNGGGAPLATETPTEIPTETPTEAPTEIPTEAPTEAPEEDDDPVSAKLKQYLKEFQPQLEALRTVFGSSMEIDCAVEGKYFIINYRYLEPFGGTAAALRKNLDDTAQNYAPMYEEIAEYSGSDEVAVIMRYIDSDGTHILDYIVDKEFAEVAAAVPSGEKYDTLEEFVYSHAFQTAISSDDDEEMMTAASVENGDTLVITYCYLTEMSDAEWELFAGLWNAAMEDEGDEIADEIEDMVLSAVNIDSCRVLFRVTDKDGKMVSQYPGE